MGLTLSAILQSLKHFDHDQLEQIVKEAQQQMFLQEVDDLEPLNLDKLPTRVIAMAA